MKLTPADLRNLTWEKLQPLLVGSRLAVLQAWREHGPGTTRQIAHKSGIDILTFRPRTTELFALALVEIVGNEGTEGIYEAIPADEARLYFELAQLERARTHEQTLLKI